MRFVYQYRTCDNKLHDGTIYASSREVAFKRLRSEGVRPIRMEIAPGVFNWLFGVGKRWLAIVVLTVVAAVSLWMWHGAETAANESARDAVAAPRHQIYGDPAILEWMEDGQFARVFQRDGDCVLAWFAQPGKTMIPSKNSITDPAKALESSLGPDVVFSDGDSRETKELKQIVNGMRQELREYLANGNGTFKSYFRRLVERFQTERQIYERTKNELDGVADVSIWEERNEALRRIGLRTIPYPKSQVFRE